MISLNSPAFLGLSQSRKIEPEVKENNAVDFSNHQQWSAEGFDVSASAERWMEEYFK